MFIRKSPNLFGFDGQTTVANLFYNMACSIGLVGLWDCVAFDEAGIKFKDKDGIQIMKDYGIRFLCPGKEEKTPMPPWSL